MHDDEPKPKRRSALRHALGGLALLFLLALGFVLLDQAGIVNLGGSARQMWVRCVGREAMREKVRVGMTRGEVVSRIGTSSGPTFATMCVLTKPGTAPPPGLDYPTPFTKAEYPEYRFNVVYHGKDVDQQDEWKVIAVEDRK